MIDFKNAALRIENKVLLPFDYDPQKPRAAVFYSSLAEQLGVSWTSIRNKVASLKRNWKKAKGDGETGIGLEEAGDVRAFLRNKCYRYSDLDEVFSSRQPPNNGISFGDVPAVRTVPARPAIPASTPPAISSPENTPPLTDPPEFDELTGDPNLPNLSSTRRVRLGPRTVMSGFAQLQNNLNTVSELELKVAQEKAAVAREQLAFKRKVHEETNLIKNAELELRKRQLEHEMDMERRRMELEESKERRKMMRIEMMP